MNKAVLCVFSALLGLLSFGINAQQLTNRQVFDYDIGDEFHYTDHACPLMDNIRITILDKSYSFDSTQIHYNHRIVNYRFDGPSQTWDTLDYTQTITIDNLDSLVLMPNTCVDSCEFFITDSYYIHPDYNGRRSNSRDMRCNTVVNYYCSYYDYFSEYSEGLGRTSRTLAVYAQGCWPDENLVYYKKGNEVWGSPITLGFNEPDKDHFILRVLGNPFTTSTVIKSERTLSSYEMYSVTGILLAQRNNLQEKTVTINRDHLPNGLYIVKFTSESGITQSLKLTIQ